MAQELKRLETALRSAHSEGDAEAAKRLAQAIRNRRAMGDQEETTPIVDKGTPDPFANIPTEINGVVLSESIRQDILDAKAIEDPKEQRLMSARIAGRLAAQDESGNFADMVSRGQFGAGLRGFGAGIFGLGDIAAAAGTAIQGIGDEEALSFGEALEAQREFRRALEEEFPVTSTISEIAGAVTGGGAAFKGATALAKSGRIPSIIQKATTLQKGQKLKNAVKISAGGSAAGGITEGVTEGEATKGALLGLAAGPLGVALTAAGKITKSGVSKLLEDPQASGIIAMAKTLGVKADEMARRFLEFKTVTGKNPTMADISNNEAAAELRTMIANHSSSSAIAREGAERVTERRGVEIAEQLTGGRVTSTSGAQKARRLVVAEEAFARADDDAIEFTADQVKDLLNDPDLLRGIPRTLRRRLDDILDEAGEGNAATLSGLDVNDIRKAMRDRGRGATGADRVFSELADEIEDVGRAQSKNFANAIDEFAARSRRGEGIDAGRKVASAKTSEFEQTVTDAVTDPNLAAGQRVGARSQIADIATEGSSSAQRLVKTLSEESGLMQRLRTILPASEVDQIQEIARLQTSAGRNIETLSPGIRARADRGVQGVVEDAVSGIVAATGGAGAGFKSNAAIKILRRLLPGGNPEVVDNIARDLFDPAKTQQVITALRRSEVDEVAILDLYTKVALSSGAGVAAVE